MRKFLVIYLILFSLSSNAQDDSFNGGAEVGISATKLFLDSIETGYTVSPLIGFSFQKQLFPKFYGGVSTVFTRKNAKLLSPSVSYQLNFIDWRLSLQYRIQPNLFIDGGAAISQFIGGRQKFTNGTKVDQKDFFSHQTNPYLGLRYKIKNNIISAKYYLPNLITKTGKFSSKNQFSYAEISLSIPFKSNSKDKIEDEKKSEEEAKSQIKALKSGILLVALSSPSSKDVKDRELDQLLVEAFKEYNFSKYFIVDLSDIDSLRKTGQISVYEDYPFSEKQKINLENFTWFIAQAGKKPIAEEDLGSAEVFNMKALVVSQSTGEKLTYPFPYFINYSKGNITESIQSFGAQLERFYYQASFDL